ncbi:MAG: OmpA family protein [Bacteroidetes bacterium]|nr:OmpA family protein [Bacteroidota bacterium]
MKQITNKTNIFLLVLFLINQSIAYSYFNSSKIKYGLFYNTTAVNTGINIKSIDDVPNFPNKSVNNVGYGNYYGISLLYNLDTNSLIRKNVDVGLKLGFVNHTSNFQYDTKFASNMNNTYNIKNTFDYFSFTPVVQTGIYGNFSTIFGIQFNVPILSEGIFNNNIRDVKIYPTSVIQPRLQIGFNYSLSFGKERIFTIMPEINAIYGLTNDIGGNFKGNWNSNYFTAGFSIQYNRNMLSELDDMENIEYEEIIKIDTIKRIVRIDAQTIKQGQVITNDTIVKRSSDKVTIQYLSKRTDTMFIPRNTIFLLDMNITAYNSQGLGIKVDDDFNISSYEEYMLLEEIPLLNKIFFDKNSSTIPDRYNQKVSSDDNKNYTIIDNYYNILNIIGERMNENCEYELRLVGSNDNNSDEEKNNLELSRARAESIKNYLVNNWNIAYDRIIVEAIGLPENPSLKENETLKMEENRRVEIYANNSSLLSPIVNENRFLSSDFERLKVDINITSNEGIEKYVVLQKLDDKIVRELSVLEPEGANGTYNLTEYLPIELNNIMDDAEMEIILLVTTSSNDVKIERNNLSVKYYPSILSAANKQTSKTNQYGTKMYKNYLVLFGLNESNISDEGFSVVSNIKDIITEDSEIHIVGFSDIIGTEKHNRRLALNRADNIKRAIDFYNTTIDNTSSVMSFDNSLPEGRFYSRAVEINVYFK